MSIQFAKINSFQQIQKNYIFIYMDMGQFKKYVTGLGGRGSSKIVTKCDKGGGVKPKSDVNNRIMCRSKCSAPIPSGVAPGSNITPHISTCAYGNFSLWKSDGYKHMCRCPTIIKKMFIRTCVALIQESYSSLISIRIFPGKSCLALTTSTSIISRPNKTKLCKQNLSYFNHLSKYLYLRLVTETKVVI